MDSYLTLHYTTEDESDHVSSYRLQEGLSLVKAIKLFVLHHEEMSSISDDPLQTNERTQ